MKIDIWPLILEFGSRLEVFTVPKGSYINGVWSQPPVVTKDNVIAAVFPAGEGFKKGHYQRISPQGTRLEGAIEIYSKQFWEISEDDGTNNYRTKVRWNGKVYKIVTRETFNTGITNSLPYYYYIATELRLDNNVPNI